MDHTAIYDSRNNAMVVYGGRTAVRGEVLGDAWSLDLAPKPRWRQIKSKGAVPESRTGHTAIYDERSGRMILTGGRPVWISGRGYSNLWELSLMGAPQWRRMNPGGEAPLNSHLVFADPSKDRMFLTSDRPMFLWRLDWAGGRAAFSQGVDLEEAEIERRDSPRALEMSLELSPGQWRDGAFLAHVSLPQVAGARLSLMDVGGRRIWSAAPDAFDVGRHSMRIAPSGHVAAGVYFLRIEQGGQARAVKVVKVQ